MTRSKRKRNPSADYWRERETEAIKHRIKDEQEYFKEVKRIFDNASVNIDKEIKAFYMRYAKKEGITLAEAKKRASQMDIEAFSTKAKRYVKTKDFSDQANEELRLYNLTMKVNRLELLKANIGLDLVDAYQDLEDITRKAMTDRTREELKRQSGILGESINDSKAAVEDIVGQSFYNATFSDRIWHNQTLLKSQLDTLISTGLIQGRNPKALSGELQRVFGVSRYNAERLLITELARVQTQSQQNAYEQCGYDEYQFITIGVGACDICRPMDGKIFKVRDMLVGENAPPLHPNCRCSTSASIGSEDNINYAKSFEDSINQDVHESMAVYSLEDAKRELLKSPVGIDTFNAIENSDVVINIINTRMHPLRARGEQSGDRIDIYARQCQNKLVFSQTIVHEMAHYRFAIGHCQHAEAICFAMEKMHLERRDYLTLNEWERMKKLAIDNYPEYNWEKGGYGNYEQFDFVKK